MSLATIQIDTPPRKRWTIEECEGLERDGYLTGHYELIDGEIIDKMGQNPLHRIALMLVAQWLVSLFGFLCVQTEKPITLPGRDGLSNAPEPAVALTAQPTTAYMMTHPNPADLLLLVEVSDTTLPYDLSTKAALYARAGVGEYWVLDIVGRRLHVHRQPGPTGYSDVQGYAETETVALQVRPEAPVTVGLFLPLHP
jgi:Uma2 family endonuclease